MATHPTDPVASTDVPADARAGDPPDPRTVEGAAWWFDQSDIQVRPLLVVDGGPGVFELGLSLGGTVSAGAYTAGVLDFLVEALDAWEQARPADPALPQHAVRLKVMAGASGGGVCATALAKALAYDFPHVRVDDPPAVQQDAQRRNPLYRLWVDQFDIDGFCSDAADGDGPPDGPVQSLLHPGPLLAGCRSVAGYPHGIDPPPPLVRRAWVAEPLTAFLTLTNITGVPYSVPYGDGESVGSRDPAAGDAPPGLHTPQTPAIQRAAPPQAGGARSQIYCRHADYVRLEFYYDRHPLHHQRSWPDAFVVLAHPDGLVPTLNGMGQPTVELPWPRVAEFARATGAFPVGFPPVQLERPAWHYLYQPVFTLQPQDGPELRLRATVLEPAWHLAGLQPTDTYRFVSVDGGALNNEPVELTRRHLAGQLGRNPRQADRACRAVIHIDPFSDTPGRPQTAVGGLQDALGRTLNALIAHARFSTQDFLSAAEARTSSRFLVTAVRHAADGSVHLGNDALATAPLAAFGGFMHHAFRRHDFFLGRRNCQRFLQKYFVLDAANPVFGRRLDADGDRDDSGDGADAAPRPIIPLVGTAAVPQAQAPWPAEALDLGEASPQRERLDAVLTRRVRVLWERMTRQIGSGPYGGELGMLLRLGTGDLVNGVARRARRAVDQALRQTGLDR